MIIIEQTFDKNNRIESHSHHTNSTIEVCKFCGFPRFTTVLMPEGRTHYAALRCGSCDGFHKWIESPHTTEERERQRQRIKELLRSPLLSEWERGFLQDVLKERKLSPKQIKKISDISDRVGGAN